MRVSFWPAGTCSAGGTSLGGREKLSWAQPTTRIAATALLPRNRAAPIPAHFVVPCVCIDELY
jgi:hypothetical protein